MDPQYYTVGMAGHIDHGKTTLTKALTNVDTDRLKEEKERNISIELGYAPLHQTENSLISIIDVPGHERFIRQMIAGVAGIDLVVLVVSADEGVMPQTKEHLEILGFLGVTNCIVAVTKTNLVEDDLLELAGLDIREALQGTNFAKAPLFFVDSITGKGITDLKEQIIHSLEKVENRDRFGSFRLPIDQVFSVQGKGTIVRGTIYEGMVKKGGSLTILPANISTKARNIQVHHEDVEQAWAGQRTAINLSGIAREEVKRGDVLVSSNHFVTTDTIDVALTFVDDLNYPIKQRSLVNVHVGTSEVRGHIIFFDRNEMVEGKEEVLCQIRLKENIVVRRGDRFIVRRPTPVETVGGGWVIDPIGEKYRFGDKTMAMLKQKKEGSPFDLVVDALSKHIILSENELIKDTSLDKAEVQAILKESPFVLISKNTFTLNEHIQRVAQRIQGQISDYHKDHSMRFGMNKAEVIQTLRIDYPKDLVEFTIEKLVSEEKVEKVDQFLAINGFIPTLPKKWEKRMEHLIQSLKDDWLQVKKWEDYLKKNTIPLEFTQELKNYLIQSDQAYPLSDDLIIHRSSFNEAVNQLKQQTNETFQLKDAKEVWNLSRKYLIPLLELMDELKVTGRVEEGRRWL
ncbi:selenocysteine-specific translation elongation factor [Aquibacillus salsiterrae]|uniref:Selenocysteine-specific elongation factor n=1 Tax=Aquibacillus salsiterrae TaxID=2950439 RepID=A0A9X3WIF9_9BACI|nr:selenocysteine-specific translation elongation factor [Aquibacillus salsiterrae]MDC3417979.1 selenocysteine-specific translation elongation factor [Aquibacillus salsiterrae]